MTCVACKHQWCWLCGETYAGPEHFTLTRCVQFDDDFFLEQGMTRDEYYRFVGGRR